MQYISHRSLQAFTRQVDCRLLPDIMYLIIGVLLGSVSLTYASCRDPEIIPQTSHDISEMSKCILPIGNDIVPGQGTLYKVQPDLINITHHIEFKLGSKEDYKNRNILFGREPMSIGSTCGWYFVKSIDYNRIPHVLYEAKCVFSKCIGNTLCDCKEVYSYTNVIRRTRCVNNTYEYSTIIEPLAVGCTCVRKPRPIRRPTMHN